MYDYPAPDFDCPNQGDAIILADLVPPDEDMTPNEAILMDGFVVRFLKSGGYCLEATEVLSDDD